MQAKPESENKLFYQLPIMLERGMDENPTLLYKTLRYLVERKPENLAKKKEIKLSEEKQKLADNSNEVLDWCRKKGLHDPVFLTYVFQSACYDSLNRAEETNRPDGVNEDWLSIKYEELKQRYEQLNQKSVSDNITEALNNIETKMVNLKLPSRFQRIPFLLFFLMSLHKMDKNLSEEWKGDYYTYAFPFLLNLTIFLSLFFLAEALLYHAVEQAARIGMRHSVFFQPPNQPKKIENNQAEVKEEVNTKKLN